MGCKFTMTNVYFKKMTLFWMVLCGKRWRINLCRVHHLQVTKNTPPPPWGLGQAPPLGLASLDHSPASACPLQPPTGVPPSGLFIVESVFICFIMKDKFAEVYWYAFLYRHIKIQLALGAGCVGCINDSGCVFFDFVTCNLLFTMRGFL